MDKEENCQSSGEKIEEDTVSIKSSNEFGRCLLAERDFSPREVILEELPLVTAPSGQTDQNEDGEHYLVCIGCFLSLKDTEEAVFPCRNCDWPFCSHACAAQDDKHKLLECEIFKSKGIQQSPASIRAVYFLRSIYIANNDEATWKKITSLTATYDGKRDKEPDEKDRAMHEYIKEECGVDAPLQVIANLSGARAVNAFQINYCELEVKRYYGMALYHLASIASHACNPNSRWRTVMPTQKRGFPIRFQANEGIYKASLVTIAYRNKCLTTGTLRRREELYLGHGFLCLCDRCADPSEFNTSFSALHCTHCESGYLLPKDSLEAKSDWICGTCGGSEQVAFVRGIIDRITLQIKRAKEGKCRPIETCYKLDIIAKKYAGRVLHPNNYLVIWAEFLWLQFLEYNLVKMGNSTLTSEIFKLIVKRAGHCRDIYTKFFSKTSRFYGYFERFIGLAHYIYFLNPAIWGKMDDTQRLSAMRAALKHFDNSLQYDGWDADELSLIEKKLVHIRGLVKTCFLSLNCQNSAKQTA